MAKRRASGIARAASSGFWFLLESGPAVATVAVAALVGVEATQGTIDEKQSLGWILTLLGFLAASELVVRLRTLSNIEKSGQQTRELMQVLMHQETLSTRQLGIRSVHENRDFKRLNDLVQACNSEIQLQGMTIYTTLNVLRLPLIEVLVRTNCTLRVLLSAADSPFLREKEDEEGIPPNSRTETSASLGILTEILTEAKARGYRGRMEVRTYARITYFTGYIFDHSSAVISLYSFGRRSIELPMIDVDGTSGGPNLLFRLVEQQFHRLWSDPRSKIVLSSANQAATLAPSPENQLDRH